MTTTRVMRQAPLVQSRFLSIEDGHVLRHVLRAQVPSTGSVRFHPTGDELQRLVHDLGRGVYKLFTLSTLSSAVMYDFNF